MKKLNKLKDQSTEVIYSCSTVFPFTLFPNRVEVTEEKVNIIYGLFFFSKKTVSLLVADLVNATVSTNPFFGTLGLELRYFEKNPPPVKYLIKNEAIMMSSVITGLIEVKRRKLSLSQVKGSKLNYLTKLGQV